MQQPDFSEPAAQRPCLFAGALGETVVNWREDIDGLVFIVFGHYPGQRCGGTEFEKSSSLSVRGAANAFWIAGCRRLKSAASAGN
jgi:hypothetical protein